MCLRGWIRTRLAYASQKEWRSPPSPIRVGIIQSWGLNRTRKQRKGEFTPSASAGRSSFSCPYVGLLALSLLPPPNPHPQPHWTLWHLDWIPPLAAWVSSLQTTDPKTSLPAQPSEPALSINLYLHVSYWCCFSTEPWLTRPLSKLSFRNVMRTAQILTNSTQLCWGTCLRAFDAKVGVLATLSCLQGTTCYISVLLLLFSH